MICPIVEINVLVEICNRYIIDCSFLGIVSFFFCWLVMLRLNVTLHRSWIRMQSRDATTRKCKGIYHIVMGVKLPRRWLETPCFTSKQALPTIHQCSKMETKKTGNKGAASIQENPSRQHFPSKSGNPGRNHSSIVANSHNDDSSGTKP